MNEKLIRFLCIASEHTPTDSRRDKLTVQEGVWAFCPFDTTAAGHVWQRITGRELDELNLRFGLSALARLPSERGVPA